jgi:5,10-methylenetetrahydrofolate reductase
VPRTLHAHWLTLDASVVALRVAAVCQYSGLTTMLHVTCASKTAAVIRDVVITAKAAGICNLLILHGDGGAPVVGASSGGSAATVSTVDVVRMVRSEFGDHFCIGVAGHPQGLPSHGIRCVQRGCLSCIARAPSLVL